ncbi:hypothetical protein DY000_02053110 [Brassica cretica]|uniref:MBD domain-containing protein n=1 Tax=Brassica cretica TaxID=69181 RepID=A0ABQ7A5R5_BRACR|nr:hypothetical protein DY000_02053110 [Brassica cretica]
MEEAGVINISHETGGETSIDRNFKTSIDTHHETEPDLRTEESTSIHRRGQPSIDSHCEFGQRAYDSDGERLFQWEKRYEYNVYRDEHGYTRAPDGRIIYVSREDIRDILERATMNGEASVCLPEHASKQDTLSTLSSFHTATIPKVHAQQYQSNKEKSLLFSDPTLLERTIRKEKRSTSIANNIRSSTDTSEQTSTDTPNPSTESCELP